MEEKEGDTRPEKETKLCAHMHVEGQVASLVLKAYIYAHCSITFRQVSETYTKSN